MEQEAPGENPSVPPSCTAGKVAFSVFKYFPYGGLQLDLMRMALEFRDRGIGVVIFCMIWDAPPPPEGIEFRELEVKAMTNHGKARKFEKLLAKELAKEHFLTHVAFNRLVPADWYFAADMPFVESVPRGFVEKLFPRYRTFAAMERSVFTPKSPTRILCITRAQQAAFQRLYGTPNARMYQLPPGINAEYASALKYREERDEVRGEFGVGEDDILLIQVSSAFRTKGVDRSIAALAALPETVRERTKLLVVGRGKIPPYAALARRCGVADRVIFAGARDDVPKLIAAADLMIHPARNEATGTVLLESLACGTPALCSGICGFSPLVEEAGNPVLPEKFQQKVLNRTLMLTLSAPGRLEELQREAENYGANADFYRRAQVAVDLILENCRHDRN